MTATAAARYKKQKQKKKKSQKIQWCFFFVMCHGCRLSHTQLLFVTASDRPGQPPVSRQTQLKARSYIFPETWYNGWFPWLEILQRGAGWVNTVTPMPLPSSLHCYFCSLRIVVLALESTLDALTAKQLIDSALSVTKTHNGGEKADIALSFYFDCYCFCGKMAFSSRKTATFLSIMHDAFLRDSTRAFPAWTMSMSHEALQSAVFKHSVQRPPRR